MQLPSRPAGHMEIGLDATSTVTTPSRRARAARTPPTATHHTQVLATPQHAGVAPFASALLPGMPQPLLLKHNASVLPEYGTLYEDDVPPQEWPVQYPVDAHTDLADVLDGDDAFLAVFGRPGEPPQRSTPRSAHSARSGQGSLLRALASSLADKVADKVAATVTENLQEGMASRAESATGSMVESLKGVAQSVRDEGESTRRHVTEDGQKTRCELTAVVLGAAEVVVDQLQQGTEQQATSAFAAARQSGEQAKQLLAVFKAGAASSAAPVAPVAPVAPAGAPAPVVVTPPAQSTATSAPYHSELPRVPENSRVLRRSRPQQAQQPAGPSYLEPTRASISAKRTKLGSSSTEDARRPLGENPNARAPHIGE